MNDMNDIQASKEKHLKAVRDLIPINDYYKILEIQDRNWHYPPHIIPLEILEIIGDNQDALRQYQSYLICRKQLQQM